MQKFVFVEACYHTDDPDCIYDGGFHMSLDHLLSFRLLEYDGNPAVKFLIDCDSWSKIAYITHDIKPFDTMLRIK